jgi:hypothetical protein
MVADDRKGKPSDDECSEGGGLVGTTTVTIRGRCIVDIDFVPADEVFALINTNV